MVKGDRPRERFARLAFRSAVVGAFAALAFVLMVVTLALTAIANVVVIRRYSY